MKQSNTFWTEIGNNFYRIKNNELHIAPILNSKVDNSKLSKVLKIDNDILELINTEFNSNFKFKTEKIA